MLIYQNILSLLRPYDYKDHFNLGTAGFSALNMPDILQPYFLHFSHASEGSLAKNI
jgi:hypothetical protein